MKLILLLVIITILLESTVTTIPLTLLLILFSAIVFRRNEIFVLAFFSGLFLDIFAVRNIGWSSIFFVTLVFIVYLYEKKFETDSLRFILLVGFVGSLIYLLILGVQNAIFQAAFSTLIIFTSFFVYKKTNKKALKYA